MFCFHCFTSAVDITPEMSPISPFRYFAISPFRVLNTPVKETTKIRVLDRDACVFVAIDNNQCSYQITQIKADVICIREVPSCLRASGQLFGLIGG